MTASDNIQIKKQSDNPPNNNRGEFETQKLEAFLKQQLNIEFDNFQVSKFDAGQSNPTYLLTMDDEQFVLRKKPAGELLPSAHMVEREYKVMSALRVTDVPVPKCPLLCENSDIVGTPFYLMDFVDGRILRDVSLPGMEPHQRRMTWYAMVQTLAKLHAVDPDGVGLEGFGKPADYVPRQIKRWSGQYEASKTEAIPAMDKLSQWLVDTMPDNAKGSADVALVHGDFRLDNLILHPDKPEVLAILDWELATLGHPLSDLAYLCMLYDFPTGLDFPGLAGHDLSELGIPPMEEIIELYCDCTGRDQVENFNYFLAFSHFRMCAILQGVYFRGIQGNASSASAQKIGKLAPIFAELGWKRAEMA
jgi:aminoglycoside phosphotransferase (APT) family kinase protein